ncbi:MAG: hypothetical protein ACFNPV_10785, partial [Corynebacterium matruchotii]
MLLALRRPKAPSVGRHAGAHEPRPEGVELSLQALRADGAGARAPVEDPEGLAGLVREHIRHSEAVALVEREAAQALAVV